MSEKELLEQEKKSEEQEEHIAWMKWIKKNLVPLHHLSNIEITK